MILNSQEYKTFISIHFELLLYARNKQKQPSHKISLAVFEDYSLSKKTKVRDYLNEHQHLANDYLLEYSGHLTKSENEIISGFNKAVSGRFIIFKLLLKHAIFIHIETNKFYAVKALSDRFNELFSDFPIIAEATILPFMGQIIYDGFLKPYHVRIGRHIFSSMNEEYKKAKANHQIITTIE